MNILTAVGDSLLANKLKQNGFNICTYDIQYKEGIIEYLEVNTHIDYIILNNNLDGNIDIDTLIEILLEEIPSIKIILVNGFVAEHKYKVYKEFKNYNVNEIVDFIILDSDSKTNYKSCFKGKILTILGVSGVGKSVFSINLANVLNCERKLIIDFDVLNNSLHYLLGVNDYTNRIQKNLKKNLIKESSKMTCINENDQKYEIDTTPIVLKTRYNVDLISGVNLIFDTKSQISTEDLKNILVRLKRVYEIIIIDTSSQCFLEYNKEIMKLSDELIFLSGASLYEVQKAKVLLKKYTEEFSISKDKFYLVFNKCNKNSIDERVLREIFNEYKVLGKIMLREYYEYIINNNKANQKKIEKEMKRIEKKGGFCGKSIRKYNKSKRFSREFRNNPKLISKINIRDGDKYSDRYRH